MKQKRRNGSGCKLRRMLSWKGSRLKKKRFAARKLKKKSRHGCVKKSRGRLLQLLLPLVWLVR